MGFMKPKTPPTPEAPPPVAVESDISADDEASVYRRKRARGFNYNKTLLADRSEQAGGGAIEKKSLLG